MTVGGLYSDTAYWHYKKYILELSRHFYWIHQVILFNIIDYIYDVIVFVNHFKVGRAFREERFLSQNRHSYLQIVGIIEVDTLFLGFKLSAVEYDLHDSMINLKCIKNLSWIIIHNFISQNNTFNYN